MNNQAIVTVLVILALLASGCTAPADPSPGTGDTGTLPVTTTTAPPAQVSEKNDDTAGTTAVFDAHDTGVSYHFADSDMDFHFGTLILGSAVNHGVEIGEAFNTAVKINDGDAASWQEEWFSMAQRAEARGEQSLAAGHSVSARDQLQRAAYYYRISLISMLPDDPRMQERADKSRELLKKAGKLFDPPLEYIEIPYEGTVIPGYFWKASGDKPAKTLIMIGGGETFAEDLFFYIAPQAHDRGYNFITVDLPGQGMMPAQNKTFRPDMDVPMRSVVDYAVSRADVDPKKIAAYGYSGGGGFVSEAAAKDPRIAAIAMNSGVVDAYPLFSTMPAVIATPEEKATWSSFHANVVKVICWRWGVSMDNPGGLADANKGFTFDPADVKVPALILVGEGDYKSQEVQRQQKVIMDGLPNPQKKMVILPSDEGATNHCTMENRSLVAQELFDWLDQVMK
ncbi:MAG: alpha/beta hydrolase [Methanomicrobiales archaeon HGW-Methanomicrobiales-3]|jgi:pimeloyl-ACP methyl ester carboxylesterase|nr:MAG: alpha/beta hydrolase [Methanomicrobiales archaeon HGW-Methanomicrobiales-3]